MNTLFAFAEHSATLPSIRHVLEQGISKHSCKNAIADISYADTIAGTRIGIGTGGPAGCNFQKAENERFLICFNGKILFNNSIKSLLGSACYIDNDAQNILLLYQQIQTQAFALLKGYWSLIIWDKSTCTLLAANDHFGNHPLFYFQKSGTLGIASLSQILYAMFPQSRTLNAEAVGNYLASGNPFAPAPNFYSDIHSLPPSHFLQYNVCTQQLQIQPYYSLPFKACTAPYNEYEEPYFADNLRQQVIDCVRTVFADKTPAAIELDGGTDNACIAYTAHRFCPDTPLAAFTLICEENGNENALAEKTARDVNAEWIPVHCSAQNILNSLPEVINAQGTPLSGMNTIARYIMLQNAHNHGFNNFVNGQGSDDMLAGYAFFFLPFLHFLRSQWLIKDYFHELIHLSNSSLSVKDMALWRLKEKAGQYCHSSGQQLKKTNPAAYQSIVAPACCQTNNPPHPKVVLNEYLYEQYTQCLPHILRQNANSAAFFNMDFIMPFACSTDLAEYAFKIPSTQKIHGGWSTYMLRKAMTGLVPDEILWKKEKKHFPACEELWYKQSEPQLKAYISEQSSDEHIRLEPIVGQWENQYGQNIHFRRFAFRVYCYLQWKHWLQKAAEK
ncbi:MAG: hypothetical protein J5701_00305 [Bacteroidales bacterium]|nr:hypothetical protein [Bacteroidales bacterium]